MNFPLSIEPSLGDKVAALVNLAKSDNSLEALLVIEFLCGEANGGRSLRGVVEVSQTGAAGGPLLSVELYQLGVPLLGELPHNFAGDFHFYKNESIILLPYLLASVYLPLPN